MVTKQKFKLSKKQKDKKKTNKPLSMKKKNNINQKGGDDNFEVVHTINITEFSGEVVTYGLVSCTSIFWHWKNKNYMVHTHSLQEGDPHNSYNRAVNKMETLEVKDINIYIYYGTAKLDELKFESFCKRNNINCIYKKYENIEHLLFIGLTKDGKLIESSDPKSNYMYIIREIQQTKEYDMLYNYILLHDKKSLIHERIILHYDHYHEKYKYDEKFKLMETLYNNSYIRNLLFLMLPSLKDVFKFKFESNNKFTNEIIFNDFLLNLMMENKLYDSAKSIINNEHFVVSTRYLYEIIEILSDGDDGKESLDNDVNERTKLYELIKLMIDKGLNINELYEGRTVLYEGVRNNLSNTCKFLLDNGASNKFNNETKNTIYIINKFKKDITGDIEVWNSVIEMLLIGVPKDKINIDLYKRKNFSILLEIIGKKIH